jgi:hypothetical protein
MATLICEPLICTKQLHLVASQNSKIRRILLHDDDNEIDSSSAVALRLLRGGMDDARDKSAAISQAISELHLSGSAPPQAHLNGKGGSAPARAGLPSKQKQIDPGIWLQVQRLPPHFTTAASPAPR